MKPMLLDQLETCDYQESIANITAPNHIAVTTVLQLPSDEVSTTALSIYPRIFRANLPAPLVVKLRDLEQDSADELAVRLLSAFVVFLARYSGEQTMTLNSAAGQLVIDLANDINFATLLQRIDERICQVCNLQIAGLTTPTVAPSTDTVTFTYHHLSDDALQSQLQLDGAVRLDIIDTVDNIQVQWVYDASRFAPDTIVRIHNNFQTLLTGIVANPVASVSSLPFVTEAERSQMLAAWNMTATPYPRNQTISQLFEEQVTQTPDAIALVFGDQHLTYRELNARANQVAHYLEQQGVGPDVLVGLYMERSLELLIGLLGILKAGGAYVAFDPTYPAERLTFMLEDTAVPVVLAQHHLLDSLPASSARVVCLDSTCSQLRYPTTNPSNQASATSLAYVSYTSGSTGRPKGVCIPHRGVVRLVKEINYLQITEEDVFLQLAPIPFDASTLEIWGSLLNGARLVIMPPQPPTLAELGQVLCQEKVSILWLTAGLFHLMVDEQLESLCQVRQLLAGGDVLSVPHVRRLLETKQHGTLINGYGPTENTTFSCCYPMTHSDQIGTTVPIGRPISNTQAYILDCALQPVPIGAIGELYVGGDGLAHGYLNRPELTAEKFVYDPFATEPGARMYRTGDLARYRSDGMIEFLGRIDHQVKIRGFRIELGEIETVLGQHPAVRETVVIAREDTPGDKQLVAYFVAVQDPPPPASELRHFVQDQLPKYMIPAAFVCLPFLPLTPNGKVDRRALPAPEAADNDTEEYTAPRTPDETLLANIWASLLGRPRVGINDDFFALGGHSLTAVRMLAQVNTALNCDIPLQVLFTAPTIAAFADAIRHGSHTNAAPAEVPDLVAESVLDPAIAPPAAAEWSLDRAPDAILLTGATGFLGAFLLHELLAQTSATIYCLVRAADTEEGAQRIEQTLTQAQIWRSEWRTRIVPIVGDLRAPLLGLAPETFQTLAETIDVIYHAGAQVNYLHSYPTLRTANVQGTVEVIRLACQTHIKPVHYVSTIAVATMSSTDTDICEDDIPAECTTSMGYVQSKWVAERLLHSARERGLPVSIYRPGRIGSHSQTGVTNQNDLFTCLLAGCVELGLAPDIPLVENLLPVDYAVQTIVHLSQQPTSAQKTFHLLSPQSITWQWVIDMLQTGGHPISLVSYQMWHTALQQATTINSDHILQALLALAPKDPGQATWLDFLPDQEISRRNTMAGLANSALHCPLVDASFLDRMLTVGM